MGHVARKRNRCSHPRSVVPNNAPPCTSNISASCVPLASTVTGLATSPISLVALHGQPCIIGHRAGTGGGQPSTSLVPLAMLSGRACNNAWFCSTMASFLQHQEMKQLQTPCRSSSLAVSCNFIACRSFLAQKTPRQAGNGGNQPCNVKCPACNNISRPRDSRASFLRHQRIAL